MHSGPARNRSGYTLSAADGSVSIAGCDVDLLPMYQVHYVRALNLASMDRRRWEPLCTDFHISWGKIYIMSIMTYDNEPLQRD